MSKKLILSIVSVVLVLMMVACGGAPQEEPAPQDPMQQPTEEPAPAPAPEPGDGDGEDEEQPQN